MAAVDAFRRVMRHLRVVARKTELATGLSAAQLFVLSAAADSPGSSLNDIALATMTDRSSVAAIVDRLVEQGFVTRARSEADARRAAISVTARGRRAMRGAAPPPTALLVAGLRALPRAQLSELVEGLVGLTDAMGIRQEPAGMLFDDRNGRQKKPVKRPRVAARGRR